MFLPLATTFPLIILAVPQVYAQVLTPLEEDQDGDGDPLNEEKDISWNCSVDLLASDTSQAMLGYKIEGTLSEDDCDFIMHYLSGQCEEQTAKGVNVTEVCN